MPHVCEPLGQVSSLASLQENRSTLLVKIPLRVPKNAGFCGAGVSPAIFLFATQPKTAGATTLHLQCP
jgi:hypothetical protein